MPTLDLTMRRAGKFSSRIKLLQPVQSPSKKYSLFTSDPNHRRIPRRLVPSEGRLAIVTDAGRDAVDVDVLLTRALKRTAKSCGPDASTLASSLAEVSARRR
jgi:hypothetical protein